MSLKTYHEKRKFNSTPEPKGKEKSEESSKNSLKFCIQKHAASHLHYDLRLELDGVLKSWAVPKGPSLDPREKRLAMMVEDHPLDYLTFEGEIPQGNYGAGEVIVWDIGTYEAFLQKSNLKKDREESEKAIRIGLRKGHIKFFLFGEKLNGEFSLIRIKSLKYSKRNNAWLLVKKDDKNVSIKDLTLDNQSAISKKSLSGESRRATSDQSLKKLLASIPSSEPPEDINPMLATLIEKPFDHPDWIFEIKWDGYRSIAHVDSKKDIRLYSRRGLSFNKKYPSVVESLRSFRNKVVLDGEIVAFDENGRPSFQLLQDYGKEDAKIAYVIFDILYFENKDISRLPLIRRKELLRSIFPKHPLLIYSDYIPEKGIGFFKEAERMKIEGIIGKRKDSRYETGYRSHNWVKVKTINRTEAVIGGFTAPHGSRKILGALVLGLYKDGKLHYIGHTGGGFNQSSLNQIYKKLKPLIIGECPFVNPPKTNAPATWVRPNLVCEIKFESWTKDGYMRQPIFIGLREDKNPREVVREKTKSRSEILLEKKTSETDELPLTNLNKIFWPEEGYTKGDVIDYYDKISEIILPYLKDRPESLNRHPNGVDKPNFFQKNWMGKLPSFAETIPIKSSDDEIVNYLLCNNKDTLLFMANLGCIEVNPWLSRVKNLDKPDFMVIDLDPGETSFDNLIKVARTTYKILQTACEESYIKTSGKKGLHIMVPMGGNYSYDEVRMFCEIIVREINRKLPELTSLERHPGKRNGKIYLDYLQNREGQTIAAPYSLRPYPGATVSTPLKWEEVKAGLTPRAFNIKTIFKRLDKYGDIWKPVLGKSVDLRHALICFGKKDSDNN